MPTLTNRLYAHGNIIVEHAIWLWSALEHVLWLEALAVGRQKEKKHLAPWSRAITPSMVRLCSTT